MFTGKTPHLHLLDRSIIGRAGVDRDTRQQQVELYALQICRLRHDVLMRELVSALFEHLDQCLGECISPSDEGIGPICIRIVAAQEGGPCLVSRVLVPRWIGYTFPQVADRMPVELSNPAGLNTAPMLADALLNR